MRRAWPFLLLAACAPRVAATEAPVCAAKPVAEPPPPPLTLPPVVGGSCSSARVAALHGAMNIHVRESQTGHGGMFELRFDQTEYPGFGIATASFVHSHDQPVFSEAQTVSVDPAEIEALVTMFERAVSTVSKNDPNHVFIEDSSRTTHFAIDIANRGERVIFESDDAQTTPATWHMRGCAPPLAYEASDDIEKAVTAFIARLGLDKLLVTARDRAKP